MNTTTRYRATELGTVIAQQGRTRQWLAKQAIVHPSLITHLIAGRRTVSEPVAVRIAVALGVPLFLVFELSEDTVLSPQGAVA